MDAKLLACAHSSLILANNFTLVSEALGVWHIICVEGNIHIVLSISKGIIMSSSVIGGVIVIIIIVIIAISASKRKK